MKLFLPLNMIHESILSFSIILFYMPLKNLDENIISVMHKF